MPFLLTGGLLGPVGGLLTGGLSSGAGSGGATTLTSQDIANIVAALVGNAAGIPVDVVKLGGDATALANLKADALTDPAVTYSAINAAVLVGTQAELTTRGLTSSWTTATTTNFGTLTTRIPGVVQPQTGDAYARINPLISGSAFTAPALAAAPTSTGTISGRLAADGLDNIIIDGMNMRQAISVMGSVLAGVVTGAETTTITYLAMGGSTPRVVMTRNQYNGRPTVQYVLPS